jgi:Ser/Thr protein kinase RdoA (MazF antagonist)
MKPLHELTRLGTIRRFRELAGKALGLYGLSHAHLEFLTIAGNILFRVYKQPQTPHGGEDDLFEPGQYLLRIHDSREQKIDAIKLEMDWLSAIRTDTRLPVPEPVRALDDSFIVKVAVPGIPGERVCTLLRWLKGRRITKHVRPHHFLAQGRAMAQLHNHAEKWRASNHLVKRRFDYDGLFIDDAGAGIPNSVAWDLLPPRHKEAYSVVARKTKLLMDDWGRNPDVYGLIHGDCGIDANVLFWKGEARIIDFDGSGFGYYAFDVAIALEHCWDDPAYTLYLDSFLEGYTAFRSLTDKQLVANDLFRAAFYVHMGLWTMAMDQTIPDSPNKLARHRKWLGYGMEFIERYLDKC